MEVVQKDLCDAEREKNAQKRIGIAQPSSKPAAKEMRPRHPVQL
jgi:hypothetical protein